MSTTIRPALLVRPSWSGTVVVLAALAALVALATVWVRGQDTALSMQQQAHEIAAGLRCPVCEDLSAADSPAPIARQMRVQIRERLAAGDSPEQIRQGFVTAYGDSVLMTPPRHGVGQLAYILPLAAVVATFLGAGLVLRGSVRRGAGGSADGEAAGELSRPARRRLHRAVEVIREEER